MSIRTIITGFVAAIALAGCGDETSRAKLVTVSGNVTHNGKPLEGASIIFSPDQSNAVSTPGSDETGPDGNFRIMYRGRSGLAPGKYQVAITKTILPTGINLSDDVKNDPQMAAMAIQSQITYGGKTGRATAAAPTPPMKLEASFDREVTGSEGAQDFDVKGAPAAATSPSSDGNSKPAARAPSAMPR